MNKLTRIEIPISGMDCSDCTRHVSHAIACLPGIEQVDVLLSSEKAFVLLDPTRIQVADIHTAIIAAGYAITDARATTSKREPDLGKLSQRIFTVLGLVFGAVILVVVLGEWLGYLDNLTFLIPFPIGVMLVLIGGAPIFFNVLRAAFKRQIIPHTLMSIGAFAALSIGEWPTAMVVIFFMHIGSFTERFSTEGARTALKDLVEMSPKTARVERAGKELEISITEINIGDTVVVRPGEEIPVDGVVMHGDATINQAALTGESMPFETSTGGTVFAATQLLQGSLKIKTRAVGANSTFGRILKLVEEAEAHRADVQQFADKFSALYLPVVMGIAALTYIFSKNPLSTAAVLLVACSCSISLATPIAMLASIGASAKRGVLIKGGKYLEILARADVLLIDKTGTLTIGKPRITDVITLGQRDAETILILAASAERYSEHPLGRALYQMALDQNMELAEANEFESLTGVGVRARIGSSLISVGKPAMFPDFSLPESAAQLEEQGKTVLLVASDGIVVGIIAAADTLRSEVPAALDKIRGLGIDHIELLTGDNEKAAASASAQLGILHRAGLLPQDKIRIVQEYQSKGHVVIMVGDGINDAPALAQANVGIAMASIGADIAIEAAHISLMREDWLLIPRVVETAKRTMRVVKGNLLLTAAYNIIGLVLAGFGFLPPMVAAALQSLPDLGILGNSARLLRDKNK